MKTGSPVSTTSKRSLLQTTCARVRLPPWENDAAVLERYDRSLYQMKVYSQDSIRYRTRCYHHSKPLGKGLWTQDSGYMAARLPEDEGISNRGNPRRYSSHEFCQGERAGQSTSLAKDFADTLVDYFTHMGNEQHLQFRASSLRNYDYSSVRVALVTSVPGYHSSTCTTTSNNAWSFA